MDLSLAQEQQMQSIATLTFAPSLDCATETDVLYPEGKLRCAAPQFEPGGGGINVARAIHMLGGKALAIYPAGGPTGAHLTHLLQQEGLTVDVVTTQDWTRQNLHVFTREQKEQYRFVMPGATLHDEEIHALRQRVAALAAGSLLVISGSLPPGMDVADLVDLLVFARQNHLHCVVDSSGPALEAAVREGGLLLIKPNRKELAALAGTTLDSLEQVVAAARDLIRREVSRYIVVSLGADGALAVSREQQVLATPPAVTALSTVGAGDSMVAALTLKLAERASLEEMLRWGVAAGTAATLRHGTQLCDSQATARLAAEVHIGR